MAQNTRRNHMVTHLAFNIKNGEKQKTLALNNKERGKAKSTQKKQKHTYLINEQTYISNSIHQLELRLNNCFTSIRYYKKTKTIGQ